MQKSFKCRRLIYKPLYHSPDSSQALFVTALLEYLSGQEGHPELEHVYFSSGVCFGEHPVHGSGSGSGSDSGLGLALGLFHSSDTRSEATHNQASGKAVVMDMRGFEDLALPLCASR